MQKFSSLVNRPALKNRKAFGELTGNHGEKPDAFDKQPFLLGKQQQAGKTLMRFFKMRLWPRAKMNKTKLKW